MSDGEARALADRHRDRAGAATTRTRASACWSSRRRRASATTRSTRASPRSGRWAGRTSSRSTRPRTPPCSATRCSRTTTRSSSCRRPAIRSMPASRLPSSATSAPAAASPASTPPPTPSTTGTGTAISSAATSSATRPGRRPRRSTSRTRPTAPPRTCRPAGSARTSGTTTARRTSPIPTCRTATTARARAASTFWRPLDETTYDEQDGNTTDDDHPIAWCQPYDGGRSWYTGDGPHRGVVLRAGLRGAPLGRHRDHGGRGLLARVHERGPERPGRGRPADRQRAADRQLHLVRAATRRARRSSTRGTSATAAGRSGRTRRTPTSSRAPTWRRSRSPTPDGGTGTAEVEVIVVDPPNRPPTVRAAADPGSGDAPLDVRFSAEGTDPDGDTLRLRVGLRRRRQCVRRPGHPPLRRAGRLRGHRHRDRPGRRDGRRDGAGDRERQPRPVGHADCRSRNPERPR